MPFLTKLSSNPACQSRDQMWSSSGSAALGAGREGKLTLAAPLQRRCPVAPLGFKIRTQWARGLEEFRVHSEIAAEWGRIHRKQVAQRSPKCEILGTLDVRGWGSWRANRTHLPYIGGN